MFLLTEDMVCGAVWEEAKNLGLRSQSSLEASAHSTSSHTDLLSL